MKKIVSILLVLCMLLAGCGGTSGGTSGAPDGSGGTEGTSGGGGTADSGSGAYRDTLNIGLSMEPVLHPWQQITMQDMPVSRQIYDPLFRDGGNGTVIPCLAESYEWIDETHVKLTLRQGVKFHDGNELTSKDIKYFFENFPNHARYVRQFSCYDHTNCEIVDDYNIIIPLKYPYVEAVFLMTRLYVPSSAAIEAAGGGDKFSTFPVGTGPYKLVKWDIGSEILTERFDDYWGGPGGEGLAKTQYIRSKIIPDSASRFIELETGGIDIAFDMGTPEFRRVESTDGLTLMTGESYYIKLLLFNMRNELLSNKDFRYALSHAVDTQAIIDTCYDGYFKPMTGLYSTLIWGHRDQGVLEYNVDLAKEYMAKSGVPEGTEIVLLAQESQDRVVAEAIQAMWGEIGVKANIMVMDGVAYEAQGYKYEASLERGSAPSLAQTIERYQHDAGLTLQPPDTGHMGDLVREALSTYDDDKRLELVHELQDVIREDRFVVPVAMGIVAWGVNDKVEGFVYDPFGAPWLSQVQVRE